MPGTVSSDRLIEELWADERPADVQTALQQHVSRLRRQLAPHEVLVTRPPGYALELEGARFDLHEFEHLCEQGREHRAAGRLREAAETFCAALALWSGKPLADLEGETFADEASARLEEVRLEALEARIDADLASGQDGELVVELQDLVRRNPLRERLRGQLMLALYRSGRQAEALSVYSDTRRTLVEELGLEPGADLQRLQHSILAHDEALLLERAAPVRPRTRMKLVVALVVAALVVVGAVGAVVALARDGSAGEATAPPAPGEGHLVAVDAATGEVIRRIPAGRTPSAVAVHSGSVWVVDADAQTVHRITEGSRVVETFSTGATPLDVAADGDAAWIANGRPRGDAQFVGPVPASLARYDATTGTERAEVELPRGKGGASNLVENHVALTPDAVWAITSDFAIVRVERSSGAVTAVSRALPAAAIASGPTGVWALGVDGSVALLDERTAKPVVRTTIPASVGSIAVGPDAVWVTSPAEGTLWRVGGGRTPTVGAIDLERGVDDLAVSDDAVWVANPLAGTLLEVDPAEGTVVRTIDLNGIPRSLAVGGTSIWAAVVADPTASTDAVRGVRSFPSAACERVVAGKVPADVLVVSDLPLQGGVRVRTQQMADAIAFVLREHGYRAGPFRVAYQSCDDSVARTGLFDEAKCAANARAYGGNADVVGVIGTFNSPCAVAALPELNRAPGGPLSMVSPFNSFVGLTRAGPGVDPSLPALLYPTGQRNYARVYPTDDLQGAALAVFARDRGHERVYVLDDGEPGYGGLQATGFEAAAQRLGLEIVARESWDPLARGYGKLAEKVARSGATAVFVGGLLDTNAARVVMDLRARLDPSVDLLAPDGLTPLPLLVEQSGAAASGMYVSLAGVVTGHLPPEGAAFVERFGKTQAGADVEPSAVYAAQATEVLLDAISRSDGTRAGVLRELSRTRVENGLLGSFGFDRNGDITESPVTILRVTSKGTGNTVLGVEGGVVARVVRPSAKLVAPDE